MRTQDNNQRLPDGRTFTISLRGLSWTGDTFVEVEKTLGNMLGVAGVFYNAENGYIHVTFNASSIGALDVLDFIGHVLYPDTRSPIQDPIKSRNATITGTGILKTSDAFPVVQLVNGISYLKQ